jgi:hypothetical protein
MQSQQENTIKKFIQKYNESISNTFHINLEELNDLSNSIYYSFQLNSMNNLPLNSPMNLSIVNNVVIENKDEQQKNEHKNICKYTFKKGDKKNEYCGIIVKPGVSLCSKHKKPDTVKVKKVVPNPKNEYKVCLLKSNPLLVKDNNGYIFKNKNVGSEIKNKNLYFVGISISSDDSEIKYLKDFSEKEKVEAEDYVERHGSKIDNCIN